MDTETTVAAPAPPQPTDQTEPLKGRVEHKDLLIALAREFGNEHGINWAAAFKAHPEWAKTLGIEPGDPTPQKIYQQVSYLRAAGLIARTTSGAKLSIAKADQHKKQRKHMSQLLREFHAKHPESFLFSDIKEHFGYTSAVTRWINRGLAKKKPGFSSGYAWTAKGNAIAAGEATLKRLSPGSSASDNSASDTSHGGSTEIMLDAIAKHRATQFSMEQIVQWTNLHRSTIYMNTSRWIRQGKLTRGRGVWIVTKRLLKESLQNNGSMSAHRAPVEDAPPAAPAPVPATPAPAQGPAINFCPCCGTDLSSLLIAANAIRQQQR